MVKTESFSWGIYLNRGTILQGDDVGVILDAIEKGT
jgi:hypothetical protein